MPSTTLDTIGQTMANEYQHVKGHSRWTKNALR